MIEIEFSLEISYEYRFEENKSLTICTNFPVPPYYPTASDSHHTPQIIYIKWVYGLIFRFLTSKFTYFHTKSSIQPLITMQNDETKRYHHHDIDVGAQAIRSDKSRMPSIRTTTSPKTIQLHHIIQSKNSRHIWSRSHDGFPLNISTHRPTCILTHKWIKIQKFKLVEQNVCRELCGARAREKVLLPCVLFLARAKLN